MEPIHFTIHAKPRTKKTSQRILRFGRFNKIVPSKAYCAFEKAVVPPLRRWWAPREPIASLVSLSAAIYIDADRAADVHAFYQGLADILVLAGVLADDNRRIIRDWDGSRVYVDRERPRVDRGARDDAHGGQQQGDERLELLVGA